MSESPFELRQQPVTHIDPNWPWRRKLRVRLFLGLIPSLAYGMWLLIHLTLRWRFCGDERSLELIRSGEAAVFPFWHGDTFMAVCISHRIRIHRRSVGMVGLSQAGEIQTRLLKKLGYHVVRGSRKGRAVEAMEDMLHAFQHGAIAGIAVDGSSGPVGVVKPGVVLLSRHGQVPIVPMGFQVDRKWVLNTWDSFIIPKPFARCVVNIAAPMMEIATDGSDEITVEQVAQVLNETRDAADEWDECTRLG